MCHQNIPLITLDNLDFSSHPGNAQAFDGIACFLMAPNWWITIRRINELSIFYLGVRPYILNILNEYIIIYKRESIVLLSISNVFSGGCQMMRSVTFSNWIAKDYIERDTQTCWHYRTNYSMGIFVMTYSAENPYSKEYVVSEDELLIQYDK